MSRYKIALVGISLPVLCTVYSFFSYQAKSPSYRSANSTRTIAKTVSAKVTIAPALRDGDYIVNIEGHSPHNNSHYYVHGCYNKGPIGAVQLLLEESTLQNLGCKRRPPQVVIFGVRKSGTTTLRDFLSFHPQLAVADREIHFLNFLSRRINGKLVYATKFVHQEEGNSIRVIGGTAYQRSFKPVESLKTYTSLMPYSTPMQLVVEKTPRYFVCKECPILLQKMIPNCKLIAIFVDPVRRAVSDYTEFLQGYRGSYPRYLKMKETFEKSVTNAKGSIKLNSPLIETGIYLKYAKRWFSVFPKENILLLDGAKLVKNPEKILQQVEGFLGIDPFFTSQTFEFNRTKGFYCLKKPISTCMGRKEGRKHVNVAPDVIAKLKEFYEPHNLQFSKFVNQTFSWTMYT